MPHAPDTSMDAIRYANMVKTGQRPPWFTWLQWQRIKHDPKRQLLAERYGEWAYLMTDKQFKYFLERDERVPGYRTSIPRVTEYK
jgi:hypothetical protein